MSYTAKISILAALSWSLLFLLMFTTGCASKKPIQPQPIKQSIKPTVTSTCDNPSDATGEYLLNTAIFRSLEICQKKRQQLESVKFCYNAEDRSARVKYKCTY